jgi:hypothetical protein
LSNGQWHHIGVRVKPGKVEILHNGAMVMDMNDDNIPASPSQSPPNNSHALNNPSIGGQGINNVQGLDLYIDEVRVYKTWLSGDDYQQAMAGQ